MKLKVDYPTPDEEQRSDHVPPSMADAITVQACCHSKRLQTSHASLPACTSTSSQPVQSSRSSRDAQTSRLPLPSLVRTSFMALASGHAALAHVAKGRHSSRGVAM